MNVTGLRVQCNLENTEDYIQYMTWSRNIWKHPSGVTRGHSSKEGHVGYMYLETRTQIREENMVWYWGSRGETVSKYKEPSTASLLIV